MNCTYIHLSKKKLPNNETLEPRLPAHAASNEGDIPRICVTDNFYYAVRSIISGNSVKVKDFIYCFSEYYDFVNQLKKNNIFSYTPTPHELYEYCTEHKTDFMFNNIAIYAAKHQLNNPNGNPFTPPDCLDFRQNNEKWFILGQKPDFKFIGYLNIIKFIEYCQKHNSSKCREANTQNWDNFDFIQQDEPNLSFTYFYGLGFNGWDKLNDKI